jgi:hypothetical protein
LRAARVILAVATVITTIGSQALAERIVRGVVVKGGRDSRHCFGPRNASRHGRGDLLRVEGFKVQDGLLFDAVRPGDEVVFSASEMNGAMTITKLSEQ